MVVQCACVCAMIVNNVKEDLRHSLPIAAHGDAVRAMKLPLLRKKNTLDKPILQRLAFQEFNHPSEPLFDELNKLY